MNHSDVMRLMPDYLEGDLPLDRRALFDAHLDECAGCAREIAEMRWTIGALRAMPEPEPPPRLVDDVMRQIRAGAAPRASRLEALREALARLLEPRILAPVSAALLVAGVLLGTQPLRELFAPTGGGLEAAAGTQIAGPTVVPIGADPRARAAAVDEVERRMLRELLAAHDSQRLQAGLGYPAGGTPPAVEPRPRAHAEPRTELLPDGESFGFGRYVLAPAPTAPAPSLSVTAQRRGERVAADAYAPPPLAPFPRGGAEGGAARLPTADEWLVHLQRSPAEFADQLAARTLAEREHWIDSLSRRAVEEGRLERVIAALRASRSPTALALADDFAAAGARHGGMQSASSSVD